MKILVLPMQFLIILYIALHSLIAKTETSSPWEKVNEKNGITIYRNSILGSSLVAVKGEGVIDASIDRIAEVLLDIPRSHEWIDYLLETRILQKTTEMDFQTYARFKSSIFFIKDREFVTHIKVEVFAKTKTIQITAKSIDEHKVAKDAVRGIIRESVMTLRALNPNQTFLSSYLHADPKGSIPHWAVNLLTKNIPLQNFESLKRQVLKPDITTNKAINNLLAKEP